MPAVNQKTYLPEALSDVEISKRSVKKEKATAVLDANSSNTSIKYQHQVPASSTTARQAA